MLPSMSSRVGASFQSLRATATLRERIVFGRLGGDIGRTPHLGTVASHG
jgi:hypothetical protein